MAYLPERRRFVQLALYCAISCSFAGTWISMAPVANLAEQRFDVGPAAINALASSFMLLYLPSSLLCLWTVERHGIRICLCVAISVNTAVVQAAGAPFSLHPASPPTPSDIGSAHPEHPAPFPHHSWPLFF